ncbi:MAG: DUF4984 domain-containing protein [Candidatus Cryptobacteroides sp.]
MKSAYKYFILAIMAVCSYVTACQEEYVTYDDAEYVMFADTLATYAIQENEMSFNIPVVSTVTRNYDRTFAVEVIDVSGEAIERLHYTLESNTVTIKAGQTRGDIVVHGNYDNLDPEAPACLTLQLIAPESVQMPLYGITTKAVLQKVCPFRPEDFSGWCVFSSMFLYQYSMTGSYQRLVNCKIKEGTENDVNPVIICRNLFKDGYDVEMVFHPEEPLDQYVTIPEGQAAADEYSFFGISYGDNQILVRNSSLYSSNFFTYGRYLYVWTELYVETLGELYGSVGHFYNVMEFISDAEARRLFNEGMPGYDDKLQ